MKIFSNTLSIYLLLLSLAPCTDGISITDSSSSYSSEGIDKHEDHSHNEEDNCTPFCSCFCCGTTVVFTTSFEVKMIDIYSTNTYGFHYFFDYSFDYKEEIWQPPAVS